MDREELIKSCTSESDSGDCRNFGIKKSIALDFGAEKVYYNFSLKETLTCCVNSNSLKKLKFRSLNCTMRLINTKFAYISTSNYVHLFITNHLAAVLCSIRKTALYEIGLTSIM